MGALGAAMQHPEACCALELQSHSAQAPNPTNAAADTASLVSEITIALHGGLSFGPLV